ncbi:penicillin-binding transpeptidase domain-containing protein [Lachnospiraceae bacterium 29-84]
MKKTMKFSMRMKKKLLGLFLLTLAVLFGLAGQLVRINLTRGEEYKRRVLSQRAYSGQSIPFQRGAILDTKGTVLAHSVDEYKIVLDCGVVNTVTNEKEEERRYVDPTVQLLVECFPDLTEEEVREALKEEPSSPYFVLGNGRRWSYDEIQVFNKKLEEKDEKGKLIYKDVKGVWFEKQYKRVYPYQTLASKVLGYASGDSGVCGLESYYNDTLNGVNGRQYGYLNEDSIYERTVKEPENGKSLVTSIDLNIQRIIEKKIAEFQEKYRDGVVEGAGSQQTAVLVMDPQTGEILAMSDRYVYDPNQKQDLSLYYSEEQIAGFTATEKSNALFNIWTSYCVHNDFEPGSTGKPFTVATGLETGKLREWYDCDGIEVIGGHDIRCVQRSGHGPQTVEQTVMNSCNDAMMQMAAEIGKEDFYKYQSIFNFGNRTYVDISGEPSTEHLVYRADDTDSTSLATNSFGQNYNVTMIQLASAFSSLINGGYYYQPHLVKKIIDDEGNTVKNIEPLLCKQTVSKQTSDTIRQYLYSTVSEGTGKSAKVEGYSMGGKTGTAQKGDRDDKKYIVSFIGFAPAENPEVLVYVVIDEANVPLDQQSSALATSMAKEIFTELLPYMNIYQDETVGHKEGQETGTEGQGAEENPGGEEGQPGDEPVTGGEEAQPGGEGTPAGEEGAQPGEEEGSGEGVEGEQGADPVGEGGTQPSGEPEYPAEGIP